MNGNHLPVGILNGIKGVKIGFISAAEKLAAGRLGIKQLSKFIIQRTMDFFLIFRVSDPDSQS